MTATVLRADARHLPLADGSVDLLITSPPYWALRSYQDNGAHYDGQLGSERTPQEFVDALIECTREWMRVLKPSGSMWINLGDKYANRPPGGNFNQKGNAAISSAGQGRRVGSRPMGSDGNSVQGIRDKSLIGIPWRYALRCIDDLGLILRAEVIWSKPNGLPESVTDRVRRSHETWFHFAVQPRYYSAVDEVREAHASAERIDRYGSNRRSPGGVADTYREASGIGGGPQNVSSMGHGANPLGKLPGSVWEIPTQPLKVPAHLGIDHFAAFPMEWPRRIIRGWSPREVCTACDEPRRAVYEDAGLSTYAALKEAGRMSYGREHAGNGSEPGNTGQTKNERGTSVTYVAKPKRLVGHACACPQPTASTTPGVVLDPFGGTGTTALVAHALGRHGISVDMSADYCRLAQWRTSDPAQIAKAAERPAPKVAEEIEGQFDLFGGAA